MEYEWIDGKLFKVWKGASGQEHYELAEGEIANDDITYDEDVENFEDRYYDR